MTKITEMELRQSAKFVGEHLVIKGIEFLRKSYNNLNYTVKPMVSINNPLREISNVLITTKDSTYHFTSWENWEKMLDTIWDIVKNFEWEAEVADCDDRASFAASLCAMVYRINTCGQMRCHIRNIKTGNTGYHYCNIIIDDSGAVYLFDVDNFGQRVKIEPRKDIAMGDWKYTPLWFIFS